ncbi:MAG: ferrous iron transport protein B [Raineya sp.]
MIGNPNAGKTSLFNQLTGLQQKVANFAGVTVEKKIGKFSLDKTHKALLTDLPGTYSLYPKSADEQVVLDFLLDTHHHEAPDLILMVIDATNMQRNLLLFSQIYDLGLPVVVVLNMIDLAEKSGWQIEMERLSQELGVPVVPTNSRTGEGIEDLKKILLNFSPKTNPSKEWETYAPFRELLAEIQRKYNLPTAYRAALYLHHYERLHFLDETEKKHLQSLQIRYQFNSLALQSQETLERFDELSGISARCSQKYEKTGSPLGFSQKIDRVLMHPLWGYGIFLGVLLLIFNAIFQWAEAPMELIEAQMSNLQNFFRENLPAHFLTNLWVDGILAGIASVLVFIPQIVLLFGFIAILEETGYMTRVMIMMDKVMRRFGLNGKSVVPLISGVACAIPAIMATRNIDNRKERLITILITPLMSCSARLPIYTVMIALVVPADTLFGFVRYQALALLLMYLLGILMALFASIILNKILRFEDKSYFVVEIPTYKMPRWKNIGLTVWEKIKTFSIEAGKVIVLISVILWALASFGWGDSLEQAEAKVKAQYQNVSQEELQARINSAKLEASFAGNLGKLIEPLIEPLGFDWKIGISLIASFAAREVFVATMSVIYGLESDEEQSVRQRMAEEINPKTGKPFYSVAVSFSLMVFYAFAMQCMSTFAIVLKETNSWKYAVGQLVFLNILAYVASLLVYQLLK